METTKGIGKAGPGRVEIRDKFTGDVIGEVTQDTRRDLRAKIHKAFQAREAVRETTFEERAELGHRVARKLEECRTELEDLMVREAGQPRQFARWEMERAIASARSLERRLELLKPRDLPAASGRNILYREPYGVVAVLPPRNTPLVVPLYTMLAALGAGNAVVEKPSRTVPLICQRVVQTAIDAGCPAGSVQFSTCPGEDAAWEFIENREIDVLVHYASSPVGKDNLIKMGSYLERTKKTLGECMLHVGGRMKKYVPELAGNDPFIVLESADLAHASAAGLLGGFAHSGQLCIAAKRFLVQRSVASAFRDRLVEGIARLHVGDPSLEETDIGPIGKHESLDIARYQVQEALERGGHLLIGGRADGPFFYPTLIEFEKTRILEGGDEEKPFLWIEESFAPVRSFIVFETVEEAVALANDGPYGLGASIFGEREQAMAIARRLAAGRVMINEGPLYGDYSLPIGGIRDSGLNGSTDKIEEMTYIKRVHLAT
ncbi:MAG TPA: aldehyde dehydrogenase family protein [Thermoanaerobaculia bacterium]|nr:aldehyde dehydrogenase family protein [Thermoanaerobaculia bacterium]